MTKLFWLLAISGWIGSTQSLAGSPPIEIKVRVIEALSPRNTTSSLGFREEFDATIQLAQSLISRDLRAAGYLLSLSTRDFDADDGVEAYEVARDAERQGVWFIIAPRRSHHFILVAKGAPETPKVSLMASATEVLNLGALNLSLYAGNSKLASMAARSLSSSHPGATYYSLVSRDCVTCGDFARVFDRESGSLGLKKLGEISFLEDAIDFRRLKTELARFRPKAILLPNYSKISAVLMGAVHEVLPTAVFVGGDGWGDQQFGFLDGNPHALHASATCVRGFPPVSIGLSQFGLGRQVMTQAGFRPSSGPGLAILKSFDGLRQLLTQAKPRDKNEFTRVFKKYGKSLFESPWGVSVYELQNGSLQFKRQIFN